MALRDNILEELLRRKEFVDVNDREERGWHQNEIHKKFLNLPAPYYNPHRKAPNEEGIPVPPIPIEFDNGTHWRGDWYVLLQILGELLKRG